mmetsp:Transcript_4034/g.14824  ORF Transcript_4034/g.14824 Transcript_4034/m.14824 type:complete len:234 (-) Transcript_4034:873-1574(-)
MPGHTLVFTASRSHVLLLDHVPEIARVEFLPSRVAQEFVAQAVVRPLFEKIFSERFFGTRVREPLVRRRAFGVCCVKPKLRGVFQLETPFWKRVVQITFHAFKVVVLEKHDFIKLFKHGVLVPLPPYVTLGKSVSARLLPPLTRNNISEALVIVVALRKNVVNRVAAGNHHRFGLAGEGRAVCDVGPLVFRDFKGNQRAVVPAPARKHIRLRDVSITSHERRLIEKPKDGIPG